MRVVTTSRTDSITIGQLSRLTGVHIETVRYYERIKMLPKPPRTVGGRRIYGPTHLRTLAFIKRSRELGFSPDDVRALLRLGAPGRASCRQVRAIALDHLNDIRAKVTDLRRLERLLAKTVAQCTGTTAPECPVHENPDRQPGQVELPPHVAVSRRPGISVMIVMPTFATVQHRDDYIVPAAVGCLVIARAPQMRH